MGSLINPSKEYFVDNCPALHKNNETQGDHPEGFEENPEMFLFELYDESRLDVEIPSNNNPVSINLTGKIKK